jgi:hypothetical protein
MSRYKPCKNPVCNHLIDADLMKQYCDSKCRQKAYRDRKKLVPKPPIQLQIGTCVCCDKPYQKRKSNQRCCSHACRQRLYIQLKKLEAMEGIA